MILLVILFAGRESYAQLNITNTLTPAQLVQNVLLGTGVTVSNVTYTGSAQSRGSFTCAGGCNLGLGSGIFLTTGNTNSPFAPASYHHSTGMGTAGDPNLDAIVAPLLTEDAAVLEFDFSVAADSVQFQYVFASEEYNDYVNTPFNDVFGFFISGPGITGTQNIALVPGTTTPVAINNVNNGGPYPGVASGPCTNCAHYVDNVGGGSVYFDGFTTVLTAKSAVYPCETYHIKLAIADVNDGIFDSGVFLAENSFSSLGQIAIFANGVPQQNSATVYACQGDSVQLCLNPSSSYSWSNNSTTQCIWVNQSNLSPSGVYSGSVFNGTGCFAFTTNINIEFIVPSATITPSGPTNLCPGQTVTLTANPGQTYQWSNGATTQSITVSTTGAYTVTVGFGPNCDAISTPVNVTVGSSSAQISGITSLCNGAATTLTANAGQSYLWSNGATSQNINVSNPGTYSVTVTQAGGCTATASVNVQVNPNPAPNITGLLAICQGQNTTLDAGLGYTGYQWSTGGTTQTVSITNSGTYTVTVTDANGCTGTTDANVVVSNNPAPNITGTLDFCSGSSTTLNGGGGFSAYSWSTGATTQNLNVTAGGNYTVTVTNALGCTGTATTAVTMNPLPSPNIMGNTSVCQGQTTSLNAGGGFNSYLWSTGATTQNLTTGVAGTYTVTVTDANGCSNTDSQAISVNPLPSPSISGTNQICNGASTTFDAGGGFSTYQWSTGATSQTINATASGPYTVTVSNVFGCTAITTEVLTVNQNPAPVISGNTDICQGQSTTIGPGPGFTTYSWSNGASTQSISVSTSGNYSVTVTDANGCTGNTSAAVTVNALPSPNVSGPPSVCSGTAVTYDAGAGYSGYQWNTGATTQTINPAASGTYTVTVTDANGCTGQASASLTINSLPAPVITGINEICQGGTTTIDAGAGYLSYQWGNGSTSQSITVNSAGPFNVTVTDANGCTGSASFGVTVNPLPSPSITGVNTVCQGQSASLNAGGGYSAYQWSNGNTTQTISTVTSGTYTVTVTDNNGCSGSTSQLVTVNALPSPNISGVLDICDGDNTTLDAGSGYSTYQWNNGSTTQTISTSLGGQYTVTVSDINGCTGSVSSSVTVNPLPQPSITGVNEVCQGSTSTFDAGSGYSTYLWSNGATTQTINPGVSGQYTVTVTDANGCSNTDLVNLTVNALPVPVISGSQEFCDGANSDLTVGTGFSSYSWSTGQSTSTINVTQAGPYTVTVTDLNGCSGSTSVNITVNPLPTPQIAGPTQICDGTSATFDAGTGYSNYIWNNGSTTQTISTSAAGTYQVTVTDLNGCIGSTDLTLTVNDLPSASLTGNNTICFGENTGLTIDLTGTAPFIIEYSDGSNPPIQVNSATNQLNLNVSPGTTTTYGLISVADANCPGSVSGIAQVVVNPLPEPLITGNLSICDGETTVLTATPGFQQYVWSDGSNANSVVTGVGGIYVVTVTDANGCEGASPGANLVVNQVPEVIFTNDTSLTCEFPYVNFNNLSDYPPGSVFTWEFGDGSSSGEVNPSHIYNDPGTYSVTLTITTPAGCESQATQDVNVVYYPLPVADFITSPDVATVFNGKIEFVDRSQYAVAWHWKFGDGDQDFNQNTEHYYNDVGDFKVSLTVTSVAGCEDTHTQIVSINPFYIPNAFTPNGDGLNDYFFNAGYELDISSFTMKIFSRWGDEVFTSESISQTWDGTTPTGDPAPQGTYVYRLQVVTKGGKEHVFTGQVNLIR